jgi:putative peptide zinc metalloprotease protein
MAAYGIASSVYRVFIMFVINTFVASKFFFIGVLIAIWAIATQVVMPIGKSLSFLLKSPALERNRGRTVATSAMILGALALLLWVVPVPSWTRAEGVVWVPEEAQVRAGTDGFIAQVLAAGDSEVVRGQPLVRAEDPFLTTSVAVIEAQLQELGAQYDEAMFADRVRAAMIAEEMVAIEGSLKRARERESNLVWHSPGNGRFVLPNAPDLPGRFVSKGQLVGYVIEPRAVTVRAVLSQDDIAQVRGNTRSVEVVLAGWDASPVLAKVRRELPAGTPELPTAVLGSTGGGALAVDPRDSKGVRALTRVFQVELELPSSIRAPYLGSRVYVRFDHGYEPAGFQLYRSFRRLLLAQFDV